MPNIDFFKEFFFFLAVGNDPAQRVTIFYFTLYDIVEAKFVINSDKYCYSLYIPKANIVHAIQFNFMFQHQKVHINMVA